MSDTRDNIVQLPCATTMDIPADRVLDGAKEADLDQAIVIGIKDGEPYYASTTSDPALMLLLVERFKARMLVPPGCGCRDE